MDPTSAVQYIHLTPILCALLTPNHFGYIFYKKQRTSFLSSGCPRVPSDLIKEIFPRKKYSKSQPSSYVVV